MGQLVFQATAGGQVALVGPNPSSNFSLNVPAVNGNLVTTGDTGTVTSTMLASSVYAAPGTIGSGTPNTGKFTSITNTGLTSGYVVYATTGGLETGSSNLYFDGTNLGIGTTSPAGNLDVKITGSSAGYNTVLGYGANGDNYYTSGSSGIHVFRASTTERMRIDASGNLLVGTTSTFASFTGVVSSQNSSGKWCMVAKDAAGNGAAIAFLWSTGSQVGSVATTSTATVYNTTSDYRLKLNAQPLTNSGEFIDSLQPKTWTWKQDGSKGSGFFAHEFQTVSPTSVFGKKDAIDEKGKPVYQSMDASTPEVMANIIAEIQSLRKRIATLEAK